MPDRRPRWQYIRQIAGLLALIGGSIGALLILATLFSSPATASWTISLAQLAASVLAAALLGSGYTLVHLDHG